MGRRNKIRRSSNILAHGTDSSLAQVSARSPAFFACKLISHKHYGSDRQDCITQGTPPVPHYSKPLHSKFFLSSADADEQQQETREKKRGKNECRRKSEGKPKEPNVSSDNIGSNRIWIVSGKHLSEPPSQKRDSKTRMITTTTTTHCMQHLLHGIHFFFGPFFFLADTERKPSSKTPQKGRAKGRTKE
jgi:hypothetical protein